jgi:SpoVK/Ycf46/Vps4 family AAA+-type ATPase
MLLLIAATNRPWALDSAMLRGGRFDTQIYVGVPDQKAREFMVNKAMKNLPFEPDVDLQKLAKALEGFGGGDIVAVCDKIRLEAYKRSVRLGAKQNITRDDCNAILSGVRNHITNEEMSKFEAYRNGMSVE